MQPFDVENQALARSRADLVFHEASTLALRAALPRKRWLTVQMTLTIPIFLYNLWLILLPLPSGHQEFMHRVALRMHVTDMFVWTNIYRPLLCAGAFCEFCAIVQLFVLPRLVSKMQALNDSDTSFSLISERSYRKLNRNTLALSISIWLASFGIQLFMIIYARAPHPWFIFLHGSAVTFVCWQGVASAGWTIYVTSLKSHCGIETFCKKLERRLETGDFTPHVRTRDGSGTASSCWLEFLADYRKLEAENVATYADLGPVVIILQASLVLPGFFEGVNAYELSRDGYRYWASCFVVVAFFFFFASVTEMLPLSAVQTLHRSETPSKRTLHSLCLDCGGKPMTADAHREYLRFLHIVEACPIRARVPGFGAVTAEKLASRLYLIAKLLPAALVLTTGILK